MVGGSGLGYEALGEDCPKESQRTANVKLTRNQCEKPKQTKSGKSGNYNTTDRCRRYPLISIGIGFL